MAVRAVILDLDGTLIDATGTAALAVPDMLRELRQSGLKVAVASNRPRANEKLQRAGLMPFIDTVLTRATVGANKGSPRWVAEACRIFDLEVNQVLWLGDSDGDMQSAINGGVIYFNAEWSNPGYQYGIPSRDPLHFSMVVRECFTKSEYWWWTCSTTDRKNRRVTSRALVDASGAGNSTLQYDLLHMLKEGKAAQVGAWRLVDFVMLHLLGSIYGEGLYSSVDLWTVYPGHTGGPNTVIHSVMDRLVKLFRDKYLDDLLLRHKESIDSGHARLGGSTVDFSNQINTILVNSAHRLRIPGKRILVFDDFETQGYSSECARNLLLEAGTADVIWVNIAKYRKARHIVTPVPHYSWDPYSAEEHRSSDFADDEVETQNHPSALAIIRESYRRVAGPVP